MDSRPLLNNVSKIIILLDSETFNNALKNDDRLAKAILTHYNPRYSKPFFDKYPSDLFFIRTPLETEYDELKYILEYRLIEDEDGDIRSIDVEWDKGSSFTRFNYKLEEIEKAAKKIFNKEKVSQDEKDYVKSVFVQASYNSQKYPENITRIFITNDNNLLKNRLWLERSLLDAQINMMYLDEAASFIDLFYKKKDEYYVKGALVLHKLF